MKSYIVATKELDGRKIYCKDIINIDFKLEKSPNILIIGRVLNYYGKPIYNAGVQIIVTKINTREIIAEGVVFTEKDGRYAASVAFNKYYEYKIKVYSPVR